jgi:hypothetical protein
MLIFHRHKPIAIGARAIVRSGTGHKYWSQFPPDKQQQVSEHAEQLHKLLFEPQIREPWRTMDVPLGGSSSPIEAQALLIEFLEIGGTREQPTLQTPKKPRCGSKPKTPTPIGKTIAAYADDLTGEATVDVLTKAREVIKRITSNEAGSLGLHPVVYFYNERGKYSRFFFLAIVRLFTEKLRDNNDQFFRKFTQVRAQLEQFLIDNKSYIALLPQNLAKHARVPVVYDFLAFLISNLMEKQPISMESAITHLNMRRQIIELTPGRTSPEFSDADKSEVFITKALKQMLVCSVCGGKLDPAKSVHYDHRTPVRLGGTAEPKNGDLIHPYCDSAIKN